MIALWCIAAFFFLGFVFMLIELYRAPDGVQDEKGFRVIQKETESADEVSPTGERGTATEVKAEHRDGILAPPVGFGGPGGR
jgi:hypothetical protein